MRPPRGRLLGTPSACHLCLAPLRSSTSPVQHKQACWATPRGTQLLKVHRSFGPAEHKTAPPYPSCPAQSSLLTACDAERRQLAECCRRCISRQELLLAPRSSLLQSLGPPRSSRPMS
jgi:hypothetical protein